MNQSLPARLRVAPSPTGDPHVGTAYMSLFNLAYARQAGGQFILRIEDTDRQRYVADSEEQIYATLRWLGLDWDEGPDIGGPCAPYRQSERLATYRPYVDQLLAAGHAYFCWCSSERLAELRHSQEATKATVTGYDRLCYGLTREQRAELPGFTPDPVVRLLIPADVELTFTDLIRGPIAAPPPDDQVILKADGFPTYHLAVVVDDHLMGITHVVRGEEWISSTPKHLLLYRRLGWTPPQFAHMPLLRNPDKSKISKRKNPAARLLWFREQGYLPQALCNFLQLLGYPPLERGDDADRKGIEVEVASFAEFAAHFDWAKINTVGPVFDLEKLDALNAWYIRSLPDAELAERLLTYLSETAQWGPTGSGLATDVERALRSTIIRPGGPTGSGLATDVEQPGGKGGADPDLADPTDSSQDTIDEADQGSPSQPTARARRILVAAVPIIKERLTTLNQALGKIDYLLSDAIVAIDADARASLPPEAATILAAAYDALVELDNFTAAAIQPLLRQVLVDGLGLKAKVAFNPVRTAIAGRKVSPPLFESMEILGRQTSLARLEALRASL